MTILIVHASAHGHTERIVHRIGDVLAADHLDVHVEAIPKHGDGPDPTGYDAVVVGTSIRAGHHLPQATRWLQRNADALASRPTALVSVSLTAAEDSDEARAATRACVDELCAETGWMPTRVECVPGALSYREYDVFTRVLMRHIARQHGQPTDTGVDVDFTDWDRVTAFAHELAATFRTADAPTT
jgi:menaquinone-dependent protoporphyrinogen oxidase